MFKWFTSLLEKREMLLFKTFLQVTLVTGAVCSLVYFGFFDKVNVELGYKHYAEETILIQWLPALRHILRMPLNTLVCIGYLVVGIHWLIHTEDLVEEKSLMYTDGYVMTVFNWMSVFYGPLQCLRIVTQLHPFAVLDQWVTLPFFAWVVVWSVHCVRHNSQSWSTSIPVICVGLSLSSYCLTLVCNYGFEICLVIHIIASVVAGLRAYKRFSNDESRSSLLKAIFCCFGFVLLKVYDLEMKKLHWVFSTISGHFLSKICDIFQIHYVNSFFLNILITRYTTEKHKTLKKKTL
ncbi:transmembrane protein 187-like [Liolophura sinensis]|uniref:transmembrane protein 187-like n=1 Tax=Liolophura sinensis TaxID=3198878 RepID=UPI003157F95D